MKNLSDIINDHHTEIVSFIDGIRNETYKKGKAEGRAETVELLEECAEEIENLYGRETELSKKIRQYLEEQNKEVSE